MCAIISSLSLSAGLGGVAWLTGIGRAARDGLAKARADHDCRPARASPIHANTTIILQN